jgi:N-formylglutamate deformylase
MGHSVVVFPVSRLVVDLERFLDDAPESMARVGMGAICAITSSGELLREVPTPKDRDLLIDIYYHPHHRRFLEAVESET